MCLWTFIFTWARIPLFSSGGIYITANELSEKLGAALIFLREERGKGTAIKIRGDYVLWSPRIYEEQIYKCLFGNIKCDATITKIKLGSVFFYATFVDFLSWWFIAFPKPPRKNQLLILAKHWTQFPSARRSLFHRCAQHCLPVSSIHYEQNELIQNATLKKLT